METEPGVYSGMCPARELLDRIADKWTALTIGILADAAAPVRFTELRRAIGGISQKMLTQTLRDLERDGLVVRVIFPSFRHASNTRSRRSERRSTNRCARFRSGPNAI